jgi:putative DNA methylase
MLALALDKIVDCNNSLCPWEPEAQCARHLFSRQAVPMVWDFGESVPIGASAGNWNEHLARVIEGMQTAIVSSHPATVLRGSATECPLPAGTIDAVITDPPYYDNVSYADLSDFFYSWLKRSIGNLYPEHFANKGTPKKIEAVADATRHGGDREKARAAYEQMMASAFAEAHRVLKPSGIMAVVYAHKTTLGWATLVDAMRNKGFTVVEAWPIDTEMGARMIAMGTAALRSSIFLVARKRDQCETGAYETQVRAELEEIVKERVTTLWEMGVTGADLVIASVGAGLRAFTRFARVEYANGEEVPAERFLTEVETVVLETILARLSKEVGGKGANLAGLDPATRFYILWRYTYKFVSLDAGEAIIFANGTHVELDGQGSLSAGSHALVSKSKGKYTLLDYTERGDDDKIGMPSENGDSASLVDVLHRTLWLMEKRPGELPKFLRAAQVNREQLRLVSQALAGPALSGGELANISPTAELSALAKLTANWQSVVEDAALTTGEKEERKGQKQLV